MSQDSADEKNLPPSEHHLRKLRDQGNFPLSEDFHVAVASMCMVLVLFLGAPLAAGWVSKLIDSALEGPVAPESAVSLAGIAAMYGGIVFCAVALTGVLAHLIARGVDGGGIKPFFDRISPKFENLNPVQGVKNKFKARSLVDLVKALVKTLVLIAGAIWIIKPHLQSILFTANCDIGCGRDVLYDIILKLVLLFLAIQIASGAVDLKLSRLLFAHENKMSKSDQKREWRDTDGDPQMKGEASSMRDEILESTSMSRRATQSEGAPPSESERLVAVYHGGKAVLFSVDFKGGSKPRVVKKYDYSGPNPEPTPNVLLFEDDVSLKALVSRPVGYMVPADVLLRLTARLEEANEAAARSAASR
jgi:type III secretion protein U